MLIVDDHAIVREGLKQIVMADPDVVVAGEAGSGDEALVRIAREDFDVVVLDLSLPDRSGFNVLSRMLASKPELPVLILSIEREDEFAVLALRAGASGYLEKRVAPEMLVNAIKQLAMGKRYLSADMAERVLLTPAQRSRAKPHELLSPREFEVFLAIVNGKAVSHIAADLHLSVKTVNNHRSHILAKLQMKSNAELVRYAMREHLIR